MKNREQIYRDVNLALANIAMPTVGKGRVWQMIAEARSLNRAAVLDWTGKRSAGKPLTVCPAVFSC